MLKKHRENLDVKSDRSNISQPDVEVGWKVLQTTNEWIKHSDVKATVILTFLGVLSNFLFTLLKDLQQRNCIVTVGVSLSVVGLFSGVFFCIKTLRPQIRNDFSPSGNSLFYGDIATVHDNHAEYARRFRALGKNQEELLEELAQQIYRNSQIAHIKSKAVSKAVVASGIGALSVSLLALTISIIFPH